MKFNFPINNFSSGEWSPRMLARTDTDQYARSCEEMTNMITQMTGGAAFRAGTASRDVLDSATQTYMNARALDAAFGGFKMLSYRPYDSVRNTLLLIMPGSWVTLPSGTAVSASADVIADMNTWDPQRTQFTMLGDLMVLVDLNGGHKTKVFYYDTVGFVYRVKNIDNEYITNKPWQTVPWDKVQALDSSVTLSLAATSGTTTLTASASYFTGNMVGTYFRFANGANPSGVGRLTGVTNGTTATISLLQAAPNAGFQYGATANAGSFWQTSAWSNANGYPRTCTSFQGRLIFGGSPAKPDTLWGSRISNYFMFEEIPEPNTTGPLGFANSAYAADNSRAFTLTPNSQEASNIVALSASKTLTVNTDRSEIVAYGSNGALGPINVVFESSTSFGAKGVQPVRVNNYLTFVQGNGRKIRDLIFSFDENQYKSTDLAFVVDHFFMDNLTSGGVDEITELTKTEGSSSVLWVRSFYGKLYALTLDRDYQVTAWATVPIGVAAEDNDPLDLSGSVLAMCGHPFGTTNRETLHAIVRRKLNGVYVASFEIMTPMWEMENLTAAENLTDLIPQYLDCSRLADLDTGKTWKTQYFGGPDSPYRNTTVAVVADGNDIGDFEVSDTPEGTITFASDYTTVLVGYRYFGRIVTSPIEQGGQTGAPVGRQKRINELVIRFYKTAGCHYGKPDTPLDEISFRDLSTPVDAPIPFFTGDKVVDFPPGYERQCQVVIEQRKPYPMHIVAIIPQGTTYD